jgi:hypothetical protein
VATPVLAPGSVLAPVPGPALGAGSALDPALDPVLDPVLAPASAEDEGSLPAEIGAFLPLGYP